MKIGNIPRGLVIFLVGIALVVAVVVGYKFLASGASTVPSGASSNNVFSALFPFGGAGSQSASAPAASSTSFNGAQSGAVPLLRQVSAKPVSGGWFAKGATATSAPSIRYMLRESGYIHETAADSFTDSRISNTTIPAIEELYAAGDSTLVLRWLNGDGNTQSAFDTVNATTSEQSLTAIPLPPFNEAAVERGGDMLTVSDQNGGSVVARMKPDGSNPRTLLASPVASWVPLIGGAKSFVETAPSSVAIGYVYEIKNGVLQKIAGGLPGLTALVSPSGRYVAVSGNGANGFTFSVVDTKTGAALPAPARATTLKCAWIPPREPLLFCAVPSAPPSAAYPDDWLLGSAALSDQAWIISPETNAAYFIGDLTDENGNGIDVENVSVDPAGSYALFMNKKDLSLWSLNIADTLARVAEK